MLMALRFEPTRFFLKGNERQKKQATYINIRTVLYYGSWVVCRYFCRATN